MLHLPDCFICKSKNIFYEPELVKRHKISENETELAVKSILEIIDGNQISPVSLPDKNELSEVESLKKSDSSKSVVKVKKCEKC